MNDIGFRFLDNMQEIVLIEEPDSTIKYANRAFCQFYGKSRDEVLGKKLLELIIPDDRTSCDMEFVVSPEHPEYRVEGRTIKANGEIAWLQFVGKGFFDSGGKLIEFQEVGLDISIWKEQIEGTVKKLANTNKKLMGASSHEQQYRKMDINGKSLGNVATYTFDDIITRNNAMLTLIKQAKAVARGDSSILIEGETGTGKELLAQAIHNRSKRANGPFVALNCGAIPSELLQSELFGYVEGAFTGATKEGRPGKFEMAHMGTLFLDEIGEMPLNQQITLLRVLETKTVTRIGDGRAINVDVRIICATNKNLFKEVCEGNFRSDLYFRLNVINFLIPPLRERKDDIYPLVDHIMKSLSMEMGKDILFSDEQLKLLYQFKWPGNIRELRNVVERLLYMPGYDLNHLLMNERFVNFGQEENLRNAPPPAEPPIVSEKEQIEQKLKECRCNIAMAARELGISRKTLYKKIAKYELKIERS